MLPALLRYMVKDCLKKVKNVLDDASHPLNNCYELLPSGKRLRTITCKTYRYEDTFVRLCNKVK